MVIYVLIVVFVCVMLTYSFEFMRIYFLLLFFFSSFLVYLLSLCVHFFFLLNCLRSCVFIFFIIVSFYLGSFCAYFLFIYFF